MIALSSEAGSLVRSKSSRSAKPSSANRPGSSGSSGREVLTDSVNAPTALVRAAGPPRRSYRMRSIDPSAAR
jgi:hypothetical protein